MEWFPIVAGAFKLIVLGVGMFFAIKWHYDKDKELARERKKSEDKSNSQN
ncbi:hypothetical protein [Ochrobactrum sp. MC-1LL]|nr:hypothetical protein [Ochrobactrum sp. MC-1LL]NKE74185.1 hypothetical protein [Ochrobactrum sp. MC-1LL]